MGIGQPAQDSLACRVDPLHVDLVHRLPDHALIGEREHERLQRSVERRVEEDLPPGLHEAVVERHGGYDTSFRIAGDYDAILRYFSSDGFRAAYIPEVLVRMRLGGESNRSVERILRKSREDYRAIRTNRIGGLHTLAFKNLRKIRQFL